MNKPVFGLIILIYLSLFTACRPKPASDSHHESVEMRIDSLEKRLLLLEQNFKPRLTVLMNQLQLHHSRMWVSGTAEKWELVNYELSKVRESLEEMDLLYGNDSLGNTTIHAGLATLSNSIDSLEKASRKGNKDEFVVGYNSLTKNCNSCHQAAGLDFYEIIKPSSPAYNKEIE